MVSLRIGAHEFNSSRMDFSDDHWNKHMNSLKPIGLNCILNTDVEAKREKPSFYQLKRLKLNSFGKVEMAKLMNLDYLGRLIGFKDEALQTYKVHRHIYAFAPSGERIHSRKREAEVPTMVSIIMEETVSGTFQLLSEGHLELVLNNCSEYWNGKEVHHLDDEARRKIMSTYEKWSDKDLQHVAYAFRPLSLDDNSPYLLEKEDVSLELKLDSKDPSATTSDAPVSDYPPPQLQRNTKMSASDMANSIPVTKNHEDLARETAKRRLPLLLRGQIFTGMVAMQNQTKEDLVEFVDDLRSAGIHFTYFSKRTERQTKAFGERMGLETDWNCCVSLADEEPEEITEKSKMPRGVLNVRPHLQDVDDIPLRLPLFANCDPDSITEMVKIFQENGEVVLSVGVSTHESNVPAFAQSNISIACESLIPKIKKGRKNRSWKFSSA